MKRLFGVTASAITLLAAACASHPHPSVSTEAPPTSVAVAQAQEAPLVALYHASGTVRGQSTAVVASKTVGYVRAVRVRSGDLVKAGQPLVDLEANDVRASVARANATLAQTFEAQAEAESGLVAARAAAKIARASYDRAATLRKEEAISGQQFDEAEAHWQGALAQEKMAEARVRSVGARISEARAGVGEASAQLGYAAIVAPFAGRILERSIDPGALATPGLPLLVIADEGALRVEAAVEESRAADVAIGDDVEIGIDALPAPITGKVGEIVPSVDAAARSFLVKIDLPRETAKLRPGTFARVGFHVGVHRALAVPTEALTTFGSLDRVYVVERGKARLRMVTRGEAQGKLTEILTGLAPNEVVVVAPPASLRDGSPVVVRP
ncbi:MAG: efflux RND transporter periplasmic adaptor subunit [Deltaproteobacteria bacterium]|nr:efflux RND transporter periplasmic adaptor subunit [Deltaproteobacteria bacterium]